jgi:hypothetical protein
MTDRRAGSAAAPSAAGGARYGQLAGGARKLRDRLCAALSRPLLGHSRYVWLLWGVSVAVLAACPMMLSDPGMWPLVLDPELLALIVIVGAHYSTLQLSLLRLRWLGALRRLRRRSTKLGRRRQCAAPHATDQRAASVAAARRASTTVRTIGVGSLRERR